MQMQVGVCTFLSGLRNESTFGLFFNYANASDTNVSRVTYGNFVRATDTPPAMACLNEDVDSFLCDVELGECALCFDRFIRVSKAARMTVALMAVCLVALFV